MIERIVRIAEYALGGERDCLVTLGLGSCVAIVLHNRVRGVGALAHCLLPEGGAGRAVSNPARYPGTVVPAMLKELRGNGTAGELVAWLVGGSSMFKSLLKESGLNVGERNVDAARTALASAGIRIVGEDTGGEVGRSLWFTVSEGRVRVRTVRGSEHVL